MDFTLLIAALGVLGVIFGWVWAASKLSNNLEHLTDAVTRLSVVIDKLDTKVNDHENRLSVTESRLMQLENVRSG